MDIRASEPISFVMSFLGVQTIAVLTKIQWNTRCFLFLQGTAKLTRSMLAHLNLDSEAESAVEFVTATKKKKPSAAGSPLNLDLIGLPTFCCSYDQKHIKHRKIRKKRFYKNKDMHFPKKNRVQFLIVVRN